MLDQTMEDIQENDVWPIFQVSSLNGQRINLVKKLLYLLPERNMKREKKQDKIISNEQNDDEISSKFIIESTMLTRDGGMMINGSEDESEHSAT